MSSLIDGPAPKNRTKRYEVFRVKSVEPQQFTILSPRIKTVGTHWHSGRSCPCDGQEASCHGCQEQWPYKWKGYLHCQHWQTNSEVFLELTEQAVMMLMKQAGDRDQLRGTLLRIRKTKGGAHGRYLIDVLERIVPGDDLPNAEDIMPTLVFLWNAKRG